MVTALARVIVTPKPVINDPQGLTVRAGLRRLGFDEVAEVRVGKYIELRIEAEDEDRARSRVSDMCRRLLANHVIEDVRYQLEIERVAETTSAAAGSAVATERGTESGP